MGNYTGGPGNDTLLVNFIPTGGETYDGAGGTDTLVVANGQQIVTFVPTNLLNFEILEFGVPQVIISADQAGQFATIKGSAVQNSLVIFVPSGSTFQVPDYTLTDWSPPSLASGLDRIILSAPGSLDTTLIARDDLPSQQILSGSDGADTLIGSNGPDILIGGNGFFGDTMTGMDGNDAFVFTNPTGGGDQAYQLLDNVDGGNGTDRVVIDGLVQLGTVTDVEEVFFQTLVTSVGPNQLIIDDTLAPGLASTAHYIGNGSVTINVNSSLLDASGITVEPGSLARFTFFGTRDTDGIIGTRFSDVIETLDGLDILAGGRGGDTYKVLDDVGAIIENPGEGTDKVVTNFSYTLPDNVENLSLTDVTLLSDPFSNAGRFLEGTGNGLDNVLRFEHVANALVQPTAVGLNGLAGNDRLIGSQFSDRLNGGPGADRMVGGGGNDRYIVNDPGDTVHEANGGGTDSVVSSIDYALGRWVENLQLIGSAVSGTGNALDNTIIGNALGNTLDGQAGDDLIIGLDGDDIILGGNGLDILIGGTGGDVQTGGGGRDIFLWRDGDFGGMTAGDSDIITDFSQADGDRISLRKVDAIVGGGDDDFTFIGTANFSGTAGELRYEFVKTATFVTGDTDGDGQADFTILLEGNITLASGDFIL